MTSRARRNENGYLLARFSITLDENGHLISSKRLHEGLDADEGGTVWYAYVESDTPSDDQICADTISAPIAGRFPETTLEDVSLPWVKNLPETFASTYGPDADLIGSIPELIWDLPGDAPSLARYRFHKHVNSSLDRLGLHSGIQHVAPDAPAMEYVTAKQRSSVARQNGVRAAATNTADGPPWSFTLEAYKANGDWQAALGLSSRASRAVSGGKAITDHPHVDFRIPWWKECDFIEDYFARVEVAMTRGRPVTRVAVVNPIESSWVRFGPGSNFGEDAGRQDQELSELTSWLLRGLVDFDIVSESLLPSQISGELTTPLKIGQCAYDVLILPRMRTIRSITLAVARRFAATGGKVMVAGETPSLVDAQVPPPDRKFNVAPCTKVPWSEGAILETISGHRDVKVDLANGSPATTLLYQMRETEDEERLVFFCNTDRANPHDTVVRIRGEWDVDILDTFTGTASRQKSRTEKGWTVLEHRFEGCSSLLLRLLSVPAEDLSFVDIAADGVLASAKQESVDLKLEEVLLSEPNVLLLSRACYRIDDDPWDGAKPRDVLDIDAEIRSRLRLPPRPANHRQSARGAAPQPERTARAYVDLRFEFESSLLLEAATFLAMENPGSARIAINGHKLPLPAEGNSEAKSWWADERIRTIPVPPCTIRKGTNAIEISMPFGPSTSLGRVYMLGSFSVDLRGGAPMLCERRRGLGWGDVVTQGHPFYAGDVTYRCSFSLGARSDVTLSVPRFAAPVVRVRWGQGRSGHIALQPRKLCLGELEAGRQEICITAIGSRYNAFGDAELSAGIEGHGLIATGVLEKPTLLVEAKSEDGEEWVVLAQ